MVSMSVPRAEQVQLYTVIARSFCDLEYLADILRIVEAYLEQHFRHQNNVCCRMDKSAKHGYIARS